MTNASFIRNCDNCAHADFEFNGGNHLLICRIENNKIVNGKDTCNKCVTNEENNAMWED